MGAFNPQALLAMLASRAQAGGGGTAPGGMATGTGSAESAVGPAARQLGSSDPGYALKMVTKIKQDIANMIPSLAMRSPASARALAATFKGLDAAIKELQQAQATLQAVGGPVGLSAIPQASPPGGTASPSMVPPSGGGM
jgi:hypothetical protein